MIRRPPNSTRTDTLFPYTTRFRSDGGVAGDGVDRDERALEPSAPVGSRCGEALQQRRYGGGLVRLGVDRLLSEDEAAGGGEGRDEVQRRRAGAAVVAASRSLAVDGDEVGPVGPGLAHPIGEAGREQRRIRSEEHTSELQSLMRISYAV